MFEFEIFKNEILNFYLKNSQSSSIPIKLENPSPANLRDFTLSILHLNCSNEDLIVIKDFFDPNSNHESLEKAIKKVDLGKLKSVQNFMNGTTKSPDEQIVKLLAVLISFEPRPYEKWKSLYEPSLQHHQDVENSFKINDEVYNGTIQQKKIKNNFLKKSQLKYYTLGVISLLSLGYGVNQHYENQGCAYWNGEQYIQIKCNNDNSDIQIIRLVNSNLLDFKKITRTDTLLKKHEYKIWYSKLGDSVEFFNQSGYHPISTHKPLKPATWYMIKKYRDKLNTSLTR